MTSIDNEHVTRIDNEHVSFPAIQVAETGLVSDPASSHSSILRRDEESGANRSKQDICSTPTSPLCPTIQEDVPDQAHTHSQTAQQDCHMGLRQVGQVGVYGNGNNSPLMCDQAFLDSVKSICEAGAQTGVKGPDPRSGVYIQKG